MNIRYGFIYFYIHLIIEIASFFVIGKYLSFEQAGILAFIYDFLAFVPQGMFGYILDEKFKFPCLLLGLIITVIGLSIMYTPITPYVIIGVVAIGNALVHVAGAERTLKESNGKITPSALFVAGGSFGVVLGKITATYNVPIWVIILIELTILIPYLYLYKNPLDLSKMCDKFNFHNTKIHPAIVIILATLVVAIRNFIAFYIPTAWNTELYQTVLLFVFMGTGKALGGFLVDKIGIKWTSIISTVGAIPFLVFGNNNMYLSIIGIMLFAFTMAVTLAIITSCLKKYPGIAFGLTTIGLFLGMVPMFCFKIEDYKVKIIMLIVISILALLILLIITKGKLKELFKKGEKNNE